MRMRVSSTSPSYERVDNMRISLDDDISVSQLLYDRSDALFLTGKAELDTEIALDSLWRHRSDNDGQ